MTCCLQRHMEDSRLIAKLVRENYALQDEVKRLEEALAAEKQKRGGYTHGTRKQDDLPKPEQS